MFLAGTVDHDSPFVEIITPEDPAQRGSQLSAMFSVSVVEVFEALQRRGVVVSVSKLIHVHSHENTEIKFDVELNLSKMCHC